MADNSPQLGGQGQQIHRTVDETEFAETWKLLDELGEIGSRLYACDCAERLLAVYMRLRPGEPHLFPAIYAARDKIMTSRNPATMRRWARRRHNQWRTELYEYGSILRWIPISGDFKDRFNINYWANLAPPILEVVAHRPIQNANDAVGAILSILEYALSRGPKMTARHATALSDLDEDLRWHRPILMKYLPIHSYLPT